MLAKDMCSQNQKVGHLICLIHNNVFWTQSNEKSHSEIFKQKQWRPENLPVFFVFFPLFFPVQRYFRRFDRHFFKKNVSAPLDNAGLFDYNMNKPVYQRKKV